MKYILHSTRRCPYCIRVRIMMHLKGFEYEIIEEPMRDWTKWMRDWKDENGERARVPVLRYVGSSGDADSGGVEHVLPESRDINMFLDSVNNAPEYTPHEGSEAFNEMEEWISWQDDEMKPVLDLYKYGENLQFDSEKNTKHMMRLGELLQKLEDHLETHKFLVEERLTLADIAIIPFIRQIMRTRGGEFDFTDYPWVVAWTRAIIEKNWFKNDVMKKYHLAEAGV